MKITMRSQKRLRNLYFHFFMKMIGTKITVGFSKFAINI